MGGTLKSYNVQVGRQRLRQHRYYKIKHPVTLSLFKYLQARFCCQIAQNILIPQILLSEWIE